MSIGKKEALLFEIGDLVDDSKELRFVDIWVAGKKITVRDNIAYIDAMVEAAKDDLMKVRDLERYQRYFVGKSVKEIHSFIVSTRQEGSPNYGLESDGFFLEHQIFDWGSNTDDALCFLVECLGKTYLTLELICNIDEKTKQGSIYSAQIDKEYIDQILKKFIGCLSENR
jgi:hypothetical protein